MKKAILLLLGIIFTSLGLFFSIIYLNLFTFGYTFFDYVHFISKRVECYFLLVGLILIVCSLKKKGA